MRGTGGNRFINGDANLVDLMRAIHEGLHELRDWADDTGRALDIGAITVDTKRIPNGNISVSVTGDLAMTTPEERIDLLALEVGRLTRERDALAEKVARVEALWLEADQGADAWGTCSGEWLRIDMLRAALDGA